MSRASRGNNWCRHRTPFGEEYKTCKVGVDYASGRPSLMPCLGECVQATVRCPQYSGYTPEEIEASEKEFSERLTRMGTIRQAIVKTVKDTGNRSGSILCPACQTGTVQYSQASNGHVHARCSTDKCASWME